MGVIAAGAAALFPPTRQAYGHGGTDDLLFGVAAIRPEKRITLAIALMDWDEALKYGRTGLESETMSILDVEIPQTTIPVSPGRNVGTLVEVAALNQKLKNLGIDTG